MKGRIGNKRYDTEKAELIETRPNGTEVYRKTGRTTSFVVYDKNGKTNSERFQDVPGEEALKYLPKKAEKKFVNNNTIRFTPHDMNRIRRHSVSLDMPMGKFLVMLVDEYEQRKKEQRN